MLDSFRGGHGTRTHNRITGDRFQGGLLTISLLSISDLFPKVHTLQGLPDPWKPVTTFLQAVTVLRHQVGGVDSGAKTLMSLFLNRNMSMVHHYREGVNPSDELIMT